MARCDECKVTINLPKGLIEQIEKTHENGNECKTPPELVERLIFHIGN